MGWYGLYWDRAKWRALVSVVMNLWVPYNAGKLSSGYTTGGLSIVSELVNLNESFVPLPHYFKGILL
jgi:hypothetical protein